MNTSELMAAAVRSAGFATRQHDDRSWSAWDDQKGDLMIAVSPSGEFALYRWRPEQSVAIGRGFTALITELARPKRKAGRHACTLPSVTLAAEG